MRRLRGGIPRALTSHKTSAGWAYRRYVTALEARLGPLPPSAKPFLREAGLCELELQRLAGEHQRAVERRRLTDARRLRRTQTGLGRQLMRLEARLEQLALNRNAPSDPLAGVRAAVEAANA